MSVLSSPYFHDGAKAFEYLESVVWADGVSCPQCGVVGGRVYDLAGVKTKASLKNPEGKVPRIATIQFSYITVATRPHEAQIHRNPD